MACAYAMNIGIVIKGRQYRWCESGPIEGYNSLGDDLDGQVRVIGDVLGFNDKKP